MRIHTVDLCHQQLLLVVRGMLWHLVGKLVFQELVCELIFLLPTDRTRHLNQHPLMILF
jgi:hypothetical protein